VVQGELRERGEGVTVKAEKAIMFKCEQCGEKQSYPYTLEHGWYEDRCVMRDNIICCFCGLDNLVVEEL
jgi:hypothetical protein